MSCTYAARASKRTRPPGLTSPKRTRRSTANTRPAAGIGTNRSAAGSLIGVTVSEPRDLAITLVAEGFPQICRNCIDEGHGRMVRWSSERFLEDQDKPR